MTATQLAIVPDPPQTPDDAILRERPSVVLPDPAKVTGPVCVDIETTGLFGDDGARVVVVSLAYLLQDDDGIWAHAFPFDIGDAARKGFEDGAPDPEGDAHQLTYNLPRDEWQFLLDWLVAVVSREGIVCQNTKFDVHMLRYGTEQYPGVDLERYVPPGLWFDTMLGTKVLDPHVPTTSLKPTAARIWGEAEVAEAKEQTEGLLAVKKRYHLLKEDGPRYDLVPWEVLGPYAFQDAVLALRLHLLQMQRIEDGDVPPGDAAQAYADECRTCRVLYRMERRGCGPFDVARSERIADAIDRRVSQLKAEIPFSPITAPAAAAYFFDTLGLAPWKPGEQPRETEQVPVIRNKKPTGEMRTRVVKQGTLDVKVCKRLAAAQVPGAAQYLEYLELVVQNRMFYRNYADLAGSDGKLRTSFRQAWVKSGRLSVERWQAQALPKRIGAHLNGKPLPEPRALFLTDPGRTRVNLDLAQAELRIAAIMADCHTMVEALNSGADLHSRNTKRIFGVDESDPDWSLKRDVGKRVTFSAIFGVGPARFQQMLLEQSSLEWTLAECKQVINAWRSLYPQFIERLEYWEGHAAQMGWVPLYDGSQSYLIEPRDYPSSGWSRRVQGSLALYVNRIWLPQIERMTAKWDALELTVHDSVVLSLPDAAVDDTVAAIKQFTEQSWFEAFGINGGCDASSFAKG